MADALLGVVTETLLARVISLSGEQISAVFGVKEDLLALEKQLEQIQALLLDAQRRSTRSRSIEVWLQELEVVAADADDLLDEFAYEVQSKKTQKGKDKVRSFFSSSNPLGFRLKMASKIKKINLQMNEIFKKAEQLGLKPAEIIKSPTGPRAIQFVDDSRIFGREDDVIKIVSLLTRSKDEKDLSVIGIVGMGGQGKTKLAQLLMMNDEVQKHFEKTVWICVSDDFNVVRVLNDMLQSLTGDASQLTNREAIVKRLSTELQGKRFLLVLDDVWNEDYQLWDLMNNTLRSIGGSKGSKIIVTTRNEAVVAAMNGSVYHLGLLSAEASQELFEKIAFGNGAATKTPELVKIGERIVARCGGVPLALRVIGGLMSSRTDESDWLKIEESIWSTLDGVFSAIKLSFDHLPSLSLKQCFAYCSIFPNESVIKKKILIQQWMAHGLLNPIGGSGLEMEDVGDYYLKILLERSLLQEPEFDMYGNILSCKMHDLVHDFALEISKGHCLSAKVGELRDDIKAVHLSIVPDESVLDESDNLNISGKIFSRLRTLHLPGNFSSKDFLAHCECKHLRVLTLADEGVEELPISVAKMKLLRYLDISRTHICALPQFISKLYNLQTLRLSFVSNLPKDFVKLVNLRHLYILEPSLVPEIGQLTSLRSLNCFRVGQDKGCQIEELSSLKHLEGSLKIVGLENVANKDDANRADLSSERNFESLKLVWSLNNTEGSVNSEHVLEALKPHSRLKGLHIVGFMGTSLPSWIQLLQNLMNIELENLEYCSQIPPLGHLKSLKILRIKHMRSVKCVGNDFYGYQSSSAGPVAFPLLKELTFIGMSSLEEWSDMVQPFSVSSSSVKLFPVLEKLEISFCPNLKRLPEGLLSASTGLESLQIQSCDKLVSIPDLSSLHSLKYLQISSCQELSVLPYGIEACRSIQTLDITCPAGVMERLCHYLTNLRELTLCLSENIDRYIPVEPMSDTAEDDIRGNDDPFSTLEDLRLSGMPMPQLKSLPEQIQRFTALRYLRLDNFDELETLPEWLGNFHSLQNLCLCNCNSLANFPSVEVMRGLTNLRLLEVSNCPILKQTCERETGKEWHKIAHIPEMHIN